jgi:hypothetical protein
MREMSGRRLFLAPSGLSWRRHHFEDASDEHAETTED